MTPTESFVRRATRIALPPSGTPSVLAWAACLVLCTPVMAQTLRVQPEVSTMLTGTSNSTYALRFDGEPSDTVLRVTPRLRAQWRAARLTADVDLSLDMIHYARGSLDDDALPRGGLNLNLKAIEGWLDVGAYATASRTTSDPFNARLNASLDGELVTVRRYGLVPVLERELTPETRVRARSELIATRRAGDFTLADPWRASNRQQHQLRLERLPVPIGMALEAQSDTVIFDSDAQSRVRQSSVRVVPALRLSPQLIAGLTFGRESLVYPLNRIEESLRGLRLEWRPGERTDLRVSAEDRYFGNGWSAAFRHRSPVIALDARVSREVVSQAAAAELAPAGDNRSVSALLSGMLTTRFPDEAQREQQVRALMDRLGLPDELAGPTELIVRSPQLQTQALLGVALMGRATVVRLSAYGLQTLRVPNPDEVLPVVFRETRQTGAAFDIDRRLGPQTTVGAEVGWSRTRGINDADGLGSTERSFRLQWRQSLSPRLDTVTGLRVQSFRSTIPELPEHIVERAVFAGLTQRF